MLSAREDLELRELGLTLGCSRGAAAVRLHRARRRLHQALERVGLEGARRGVGRGGRWNRGSTWVTVDQRCPGPGSGTISLMTAAHANHFRGQGVPRPIGSFDLRHPACPGAAASLIGG
jgi:hypothetical protein